MTEDFDGAPAVYHADGIAEAFAKRFGQQISRRDLFVAAAIQGFLASDRVDWNLHEDKETGVMIDRAIYVADVTMRRMTEVEF